MFSAIAFICVYNEEDIIHWTVRHLIEQGIGVYIIDNWSTDRSAEIARQFPLIGYEKFPAAPSPYYSWQPLLHRVETLAAASEASWCIHHDADEIRRSPRDGETLLEGLRRIDACGFNALDHELYEFRPIDEGYQGDPENYFQYYEQPSKLPQVKAWKNFGQYVELVDGGHHVEFQGINVCPEKFVYKHYPWRSTAQAERKICVERVPRYDPYEHEKLRWHVQYDELIRHPKWIYDPQTLKRWEKVAVNA